LTDPKVEELVL